VLRLAATSDLDGATLGLVRVLLDDAFEGEFTDDDWQHALGGTHALIEVDGVLVAHGALVERTLWVGGEQRRAGYVEGVAVAAGHRRQGHAHTLMAALEERGQELELLALSASDAGAALYLSRGWRPWRGPTAVMTPEGPKATPDDDGSTYVLETGTALDLDSGLACDWRAGDVW
jgi:aminoglycoside 2'-N-acetyltransferase I